MAEPCRLFHAWNKWSEPFKGETRWQASVIPVMLQRRVCERCGKEEWRRI